MPEATKRIKKYLARGGVRCLFCETTNISIRGIIKSDYEGFKQNVLCFDCGSTWTDYYKLHDIINIKKNTT